MYSILLTIIYLAFISLGLPDSLLGSAWPVLYKQLGVPLSFAGILTILISCGTVFSSLLSERVTRRFGTGKVTALSVFLTMIALFGFSCADSFSMLCVLAIPYGLGAGAVDAALNNFVALHYTQRHMHWLHCFWGVGVSISPYIMSLCLLSGAGWSAGYWWVAMIQTALTLILFFSLPLWRRIEEPMPNTHTAQLKTKGISLREAFRIPGVKEVLAGFFGYCALESSTGLWASSYLVLNRGISAESAAACASLFFLGITFGRFFSGLIANHFKDRNMVRIGLVLIFIGISIILIPCRADMIPLFGLIIIGLGAAPVYPAIIHETPLNFGKGNSQAVIGIEMAGAYIGATLMPPCFGFIAEIAGIGSYPLWLLLIFGLMTWMLERKNKICKIPPKA